MAEWIPVRIISIKRRDERGNESTDDMGLAAALARGEIRQAAEIEIVVTEDPSSPSAPNEAIRVKITGVETPQPRGAGDIEVIPQLHVDKIA